MIKQAFAQATETVASVATSAAPAAAEAAAKGRISPGMSFMMKTLLIFLIIYFIAVRPAQMRAKQHAQSIEAVKPGAKVLIAGAITGKVTKVIGDEAYVEIADKVEIKVLKAKITDILETPEDKKAEAKKKG